MGTNRQIAIQTSSNYPVRFVGSGRRLAVAALNRAQRESGLIFPYQYRRFMLQHNGGKPCPAFFVLRRGRERETDWVTSFCSITLSKNNPLNFHGCQMLLHRYAEAGIPSPSKCIAIGSDGLDDSILLHTDGKRKGEVWLKAWDEIIANNKNDNRPYDCMYKLASSLSEFFAILCPAEEADRRVAAALARMTSRSSSKSKRRSLMQ